MLCCSDLESKWWIHVSSWITSCEINFCWVTSVSFEKFFRNLCAVLALAILTPIWQTLCSYAEMYKLFIAQKSRCACRVLSFATIRSKYYFNFILNRTRSGRELFITSHTLMVCHCNIYLYSPLVFSSHHVLFKCPFYIVLFCVTAFSDGFCNFCVNYTMCNYLYTDYLT